jgi:hypothetical protein
MMINIKPWNPFSKRKVRMGNSKYFLKIFEKTLGRLVLPNESFKRDFYFKGA